MIALLAGVAGGLVVGSYVGNRVHDGLRVAGASPAASLSIGLGTQIAIGVGTYFVARAYL